MPRFRREGRWIAVLALLGAAAAVAPAQAPPAPPIARTRGFGVKPQPVAPPRRTIAPPAPLFQAPRRPGWGVRADAEGWIDTDVRVRGRPHRQPGLTVVKGDEWIARLRPGASPHAVARRLGLRVKRTSKLPDTYIFERDPEADAAGLAGLAAVASQLDYIEPNLTCRVCDVPNDERFAEQWNLQMIQMPPAWSLQKGTIDPFNPFSPDGVVVAVVDTGISFMHPDLHGRLLPGFDVYNNDPDPSDDNGHGTHVAGIIAAVTNNQIGVAGVAWEGVKLLPIKAFNSLGDTSLVMLAEGIRKAADLKAHVINVSAGTEFDSVTVREAVRYALSRPHKPILVAAAGNESERHLGRVRPVIYPANYPDARIVAVGAVGQNGTIAFYSNANSRPPDSQNGGVDIVAPGGNDPTLGDNVAELILSTGYDPFRRRDIYELMQGTSFAAPAVSGAVALLLSEGVAPDNVERALYSSADRRGSTGRTETYGWGLLNTSAALQTAAAFPRIRWPRPDFPVETASTLLLADVMGAPRELFRVFIDGAEVADVSTRAVDDRTQQIADRRNLAPGLHTLEIVAKSPVTGRERSSRVEFRVAPRVLQPGWHLLTLPYGLTTGDPALVFGGKPYRMARWVTGSAEYAFHDPPTQRRDARATFHPTGTKLAASPAGLGYWVHLAETTTLLLPGDPVLSSEYRIPLAKGWSMVGNPYVFPIGLASLKYQVGTQTLSLAQAIAKGWLGRDIYAYASGTAPHYVALSAASGVLAPYQAVWVRANTAGTLIVPGG